MVVSISGIVASLAITEFIAFITGLRLVERHLVSGGASAPTANGYQVRVTAGTDPATGERIVLTETSPTLKEAERARVRLLAEADSMKRARTKASFGHARSTPSSVAP